MIDDVAKALCAAAGRCLDGKNVKDVCAHCDENHTVCNMWPTFRVEAQWAIVAAYQWHKKNRRWPEFVTTLAQKSKHKQSFN